MEMIVAWPILSSDSDDLLFTAGFDGDLGLAVALFELDGLALEMDVGPVGLEMLVDDLDEVEISARKQLVHQLDHGDLGAELLIDHAELETDHTSADQHHAARCALEAHGFARRDDDVAIGLETGDRDHLCSGGDDDALGSGVAFGLAVGG